MSGHINTSAAHAVSLHGVQIFCSHDSLPNSSAFHMHETDCADCVQCPMLRSVYLQILHDRQELGGQIVQEPSSRSSGLYVGEALHAYQDSLQ